MNRFNFTPPAGKLSLEDLELVIQWCTSTYCSISRNSAVERIWQTVVPREAMKHPFLLHGLLALSALHIAFNNEGDERDHYSKIAQSHQIQSLASLKHTAGCVNRTNCEAVFAVSNIVTASFFALPSLRGPVPGGSAIDDLCEVFQSTRESMNLLTEAAQWVEDTELRPLVKSTPTMPNTSRLAILCLQRLNMTLASRDPQHEKDVYDIALQHLASSLETLAQGGEATPVAFLWILRIPSRFIELLRERQPFALVILAHYAVTIHSMRGHWWMGDLGERVLHEIGLHLNAEWRQSIDWVIDATGCYIPTPAIQNSQSVLL
ncbi:hypothetical protein MW887_010012 [Aspergillus wentii]|nr:hypothetical protein MW887_010012 [Aspergillus wentii]